MRGDTGGAACGIAQPETMTGSIVVVIRPLWCRRCCPYIARVAVSRAVRVRSAHDFASSPPPGRRPPPGRLTFREIAALLGIR